MAAPVLMVDGQRYKDRVTIVTGAARGIGEGIAKYFVLHGSKVIGVDKRECPSWLAEVNTAGPGSLEFYQCDLTKEDQVQGMVNHVAEKYGQIDCLINNAGWHPDHRPIDDFTADELRSLMDINMTSQFLTCKYSMPYLRKTKGNVINLASMVARLGQLHAVTYAATKGAILAFTKALAVDEAKYHVRVNAILPCNVWTPLWSESRTTEGEDKLAELKQNASDVHLLGVIASPHDIALGCMYLAADATMVTGVELPVSGGAELDVGYKTRLESDEILRFVHLKNQIKKQ